jgi:hypothetical protein
MKSWVESWDRCQKSWNLVVNVSAEADDVSGDTAERERERFLTC